MKGPMIAAILATCLMIPQAFADHERHGSRRGMDGEFFSMVHRLERAADKIGLTDDQRDALYDVVDGARDEVRELHRAMRGNRKALKAAQEGDAYDPAAIESLARAHGDLAAERIILSSRIRNDLRAVLSEEQLAQVADMRSKRREKRGR